MDRIHIILLLACILMCRNSIAQEDTTHPEAKISLRYFVNNNKAQYILIESKLKTADKWQPIAGQVLQLYLDSNKAENLITKLQTNSKGIAKAIIQPELKSLWDAASTHKFIVVTEGSSKEEETTTEFVISKARILIDTSSVDSVRSVNVQVMKLENDLWLPANDVELKVGIRRMGSDLSIGDEETYTTDSLGEVIAEFKRIKIPGNEKGSLILVASIIDNEQFGNLYIEKSVNWGLPSSDVSSFEGRELWAARGKAPVWLMLMAYTMIASVWLVILYLVYIIIKIKRISKDAPE